MSLIVKRLTMSMVVLEKREVDREDERRDDRSKKSGYPIVASTAVEILCLSRPPRIQIPVVFYMVGELSKLRQGLEHRVVNLNTRIWSYLMTQAHPSSQTQPVGSCTSEYPDSHLN